MKKVLTVLGPIAPEALGVCDYHDHLITIGGGEVRADNDLLLDRVDYAVQDLEQFRRDGGNALVDMNPIACGRAIGPLLEIARAVPVHILSTTGFQRGVYYQPAHWVHRYRLEQLADLVIEDITERVDLHNYEGPIVERTEARAGLIKWATHYNHMMPIEEKMGRAVAIAQRATGAVVSTHTERGTMGHEQLDLLEREGVSPSRVILGHIDRNPDFEYHKELAARGAFLGYDGPSRVKYWPDSVLAELMLKMVDAGYGKHLLLGGDMGRRTYWKAYGGGPGLSYFLTNFVPRLRRAGLSEEAARDILVNNPVRAFAFEIPVRSGVHAP